MSSLSKLARFLRPYWKEVIIAPLLMVIEVAMDLMQPRLMQRIIDVGIAQLDMTVVINTALLQQGWFRIKLLLLVAMVVYHWRCLRWIRELAAGRIPDNSRWLRWFNEIPVLFLLGIICLAIVKPF